MLSINTNMPSLIAQRSLNNSTKLLNQAIERMTTGFKINHASDNAANFSITTNMGVKLSSYAVAEDNVASGLDLLSTAGGSLDLISDKLTRLRALAEQAANGTCGDQSLKAINSEARAIIDETSRAINNTEYNGIKLFEHSGRFLEDIQERDTSNLDSLSSVDENAVITSGTYSISSAEELAKLATMANNEKIQGGEYVLANDIDLSAYSTGNGWTPIGSQNWSRKQFIGIFDGNGHVISNLYINSSASNIGLFGTAQGEIKNLGLENVDIKGNIGVGALIGTTSQDYGDISDSKLTVENCYVKGGSIEISNNIGGGLIGDLRTESGVIKSCYTDVTINSSGNYVGGLIGTTRSGSKGFVIEDCYSTANITQSAIVAGGLIGGILSTNNLIKNCYATGDINCTNSETVGGGLIGQICSGNNEIVDCYATGNVKGGWKDGGFIGHITSSNNLKCVITHCYATGDVSSNSDCGGFIGCCNSGNTVIKNSYSSGNVQGNSDIGGFVGWNTGSSVLNIENSYALAKGGKVNGIMVGYNSTPDNLTVNHCGYSSELSNLCSKLVNGNSNPDNITENSIYSGKTPFKLGVIETVFQVGINGDENSQITLETSFSIQELYDLYNLGLENKNHTGIIDELLNKISAKQTEFGAAENRLESALEEISTQYDNLVSSRSTLRDADIAEVSSDYIRQQILQQASATLMATANQSPSLALQLI